jgi:hypothetical protein
MFKGKNRFSHYVYLWSFVICGRNVVFVCNHVYPKAALAFKVSNSVAGVGNQGIKDWLVFICIFIYKINE